MSLSTPKSQQSSSIETRRPSAVYNSLQDMLNAGGRNSISQFASSYSRSANFINADFDMSTDRPKTLSFGSTFSEQSPLLSGTNGEFSQSQHPSTIEEVLHSDEESASDGMSLRSLVLKNSGNSTAPQTIFNGINTLIGIGILSLPLGLNYAGWVLGSIILACCALSTQYTAKLLARCLKKDESLKTYGDIASFSFGKIAYMIVVSTFTIDLLSAGTSMIIIFADSFNALTGIDKIIFKAIISISFFLSSFLELNVLSRFSLVGIICTSFIVVTVLFCGFRKTEAPGSLIDISPTSLWPKDLMSLSLSIGIFMSPFGGHAIFPELYRDMRHPQKYDSSCSTIFFSTWIVDYVMASLGYLMFGALITDQVTKSIMTEKGFPPWIKVVLVTLMGILPVSKGPLILRPIITLVDQFAFKKVSHLSHKSNKKFLLKLANRFVVVLIFFITSLVFTDFGKIMSFLGSTICFAICIIFPLSFYLKLYYEELSSLKKALYIMSVFIAALFAISGTIAVVVA